MSDIPGRAAVSGIMPSEVAPKRDDLPVEADPHFWQQRCQCRSEQANQPILKTKKSCRQAIYGVKIVAKLKTFATTQTRSRAL
jgi:hypothetical protein